MDVHVHVRSHSPICSSKARHCPDAKVKTCTSYPFGLTLEGQRALHNYYDIFTTQWGKYYKRREFSFNFSSWFQKERETSITTSVCAVTKNQTLQCTRRLSNQPSHTGQVSFILRAIETQKRCHTDVAWVNQEKNESQKEHFSWVLKGE